MKTLLEWLEENRSELEDGIYEYVTGGGVYCQGTVLSVGVIDYTMDKYMVENGNISLITPYNQVKENKSASDYLEEGAKLLKERGKQYDKSDEERSMEKIVKIFNLQTGQNLSVIEGWYFMQVLKDVRFFQNTEKPHEDSLVDGINYRALMTEEAMKNE